MIVVFTKGLQNTGQGAVLLVTRGTFPIEKETLTADRTLDMRGGIGGLA
jgi:hypothetical protein